MHISKASLAASTIVLVGAFGFVASASAAPRAKQHKAGVHFAARTSHGGGGALVSDGPGTGMGFHRLPAPFRIGARIHEDRQRQALHETVAIDALTHGSYRSGFLGDDEAGNVPYSSYGVFNGADGYGSPYFAGYYGPGDGEDYGVFGHAYADDN